MITLFIQEILRIRFRDRWDPVYGSQVHALKMDVNRIADARAHDEFETMRQVKNAALVEAIVFGVAFIVLL